MNKATIKNLLIALVVLAIATMMACSLAVSADTGSTVEVMLDGIGNQGGKSIGSDASYVSIKVMNSLGVQVGSGTLTQNEVTKVWKGTIHVTTNGQMTFKATAGIVAAQVDWLGEATYNVGLDTVPLTITVDAPVVTTGLGNGYGPAGGKIFYDLGPYGLGAGATWRQHRATRSRASRGAISRTRQQTLWVWAMQLGTAKGIRQPSWARQGVPPAQPISATT